MVSLRNLELYLLEHPEVPDGASLLERFKAVAGGDNVLVAKLFEDVVGKDFARTFYGATMPDDRHHIILRIELARMREADAARRALQIISN